MQEAADFRERWVPGARHARGYRTVLVVGATGSGKSSLVRALLGTSRAEGFPAVSRAKTTTATTEIVCAPDPRFYAVVTFRTRADVRAALVENVLRAVGSMAESRPAEVVLGDLVEHEDQRLRLVHLLGPTGPADDPWDPYGPLLERLRPLGERMRAGFDVTDDPRVLAVADELLAAVSDRIRRPGGGTWVPEAAARPDTAPDGGPPATGGPGDDHWPDGWYMAASSRSELFERLAPFTSNEAERFGTLVTPLVDGVRLRGPFLPRWASGVPHLMLVDSEGLGHVAATASSLPAELVDQLELADVVVVVDNACQPVQAATAAALHQVTANGHTRKLTMVFTHVDRVVGPDLPDDTARRRLLLDSYRQAVAHIGAELGPSAARTLRRVGDARCFLVGGLDDPTEATERTVAQLAASVLRDLGEQGSLTAPVTVGTAALEEGVRSAVEAFSRRWLAILDLERTTGVTSAHWTTIRALTQRPAEERGDGFKDLRPVEELAASVAAATRAVLDAAVHDGTTVAVDVDDPSGDAVVDAAAEEISQRIRRQARLHLIEQPQGDWIEAFRASGAGSPRARSTIVADRIFGPALRLDPPGPLLTACADAVRGAVRQSGFRLGEADVVDVRDEIPPPRVTTRATGSRPTVPVPAPFASPEPAPPPVAPSASPSGSSATSPTGSSSAATTNGH